MHPINPKIELTNLREVMETNLDGTTAKAFEEIKERGFEPFLVRGVSTTSKIYGRTRVGLDEGAVIMLPGDLGEDYTAVLFANNPKYTFEKLRFKSIHKEAAALVPTHNNHLPIRQIDIMEYDGEYIYSEGHPCRDWN